MSTISVQLQHRKWQYRREWLQDASNIVERPSPPASPEELLLPGKWQILVLLPVRKRSCIKAMEAGMALLAAIGTKPEDAYLDDNHWEMWLKPADFHAVQELAQQIRLWLTNNGYEARFEDRSACPLLAPKARNRRFPARIQIIQAEEPVLPGKWQMTVRIPTHSGTEQQRLAMPGRSLAAHLGLTEERGFEDLPSFALNFNSRGSASFEPVSLASSLYNRLFGRTVQKLDPSDNETQAWSDCEE
jgi:hypothetical protein